MAKTPQNTHLGNTTFRRPWRIPEGLRALRDLQNLYSFKKNKKSEDFEKALEKEFVKREVIDSAGTSGEWTGSFGRKFLNLCQHFGFVTPRPKVKHGTGEFILDEEGNDSFIIEILKKLPSNFKIQKKPFSITPLGNLLLNTQSDGKELNAEQKDIFLKSLFNQTQPSILQPYSKNYKGERFNLLKVYVDIIFELKNRKKDEWISEGEMAAVVNRYKQNNVNIIVDEILEFRKEKKGKEKVFARSWYKQKSGSVKGFNTSYDYLDINFSYPVSTGIFKKRGRKIILNSDNIDIAIEISKINIKQKEDSLEYLKNLWSGEILPFESSKLLTKTTTKIFKILDEKYNYKDFAYTQKQIPNLDNKKIKKLFYDASDKLDEKREYEYYLQQKPLKNEISELLNNAEGKIKIYNEEVKPLPEHLEWMFWRAFLAINSITNNIKDTRGFPIDDDFLPTHHASGGKEDLIFEFKNFKLIVEVTYKTGSVQHKDEYEPVYRHTIKRMQEDASKPVYCLFVAPKIYNNTAKDFKDYFFNNKNEKVFGNIIPMEIKQFTKIFNYLFVIKESLTPDLLKEIFDEVLMSRELFEPLEWLANINTIIENRIN